MSGAEITPSAAPEPRATEARVTDADPSTETGGSQEPPVEWSFNPWRERPAASVAAAGFSLAAVALLRWIDRPWSECVVLGVAVAAAFAPVLISVRCRVDGEGIAQRGAFGWERRPWAEIRRAVPTEAGLLVSPFRRPRRLDTFRSLALPIPRRDREALLDRLAGHLVRHEL